MLAQSLTVIRGAYSAKKVSKLWVKFHWILLGFINGDLTHWPQKQNCFRYHVPLQLIGWSDTGILHPQMTCLIRYITTANSMDSHCHSSSCSCGCPLPISVYSPSPASFHRYLTARASKSWRQRLSSFTVLKHLQVQYYVVCCEKGLIAHVTWRPLLRLLSWYPCIKSSLWLQVIWTLYFSVPKLQMNCNDLT